MALDLVHRVCAVGHGAQVQPLKHHLVPGEGSYDRTATRQVSARRRLSEDTVALEPARFMPRGWCPSPLSTPLPPQRSTP